MMEFQNVYDAFRIWTLLAVAAGIIGIGLLIYSLKVRKRINVLGAILFGHMFLCGLILLSLNSIFSNRAKLELLNIINDPKLDLTVCDKSVTQELKRAIIFELQNFKEIPRHHSQPLDTLPIRLLRNGADIRIRIQRDSDRVNEYWIYWDTYKITSDNAIGYIHTSTFTNIGCR